jgi:hypothetical protein
MAAGRAPRYRVAMKTHPAQTHTELQALVASLFERFPALLGFSIEDARPSDAAGSGGEAEGDLCLAHVATFPGYAAPAGLMGEIAVPLQELLDEEPAARELLRGRTFARALH